MPGISSMVTWKNHDHLILILSTFLMMMIVCNSAAVCPNPVITFIQKQCFKSKFSSSDPVLEVLFPPNHSRTTASSFSIYFELHHFVVPEDGFISIRDTKISYSHKSRSNYITINGVEPGTHILEIQLMGKTVKGKNYEKVGNRIYYHFEAVLSDEDILKERYSLKPSQQASTFLVNLITNKKKHIKVCIVSSTSHYDGQKKIWLQLMGNLPKARFSFEVMSFMNAVPGPILDALKILKIPVKNIPLEVKQLDADRFNLTSDNVLDIFLESLFNTIPINYLAHERVRLDNFKLEPSWANNLLHKLVTSIQSCNGDILLFGNARSSGDVALTAASRIAGKSRIIMELPNLYPKKNLILDSVVAPSHYVLQHLSVLSSIQPSIPQYVINPGLEMSAYNIGRISKLYNLSRIASEIGISFENKLSMQFSRGNSIANHDSHQIIGYIGRLSVEKGLGTLLSSLKYLVHQDVDKQKFQSVRLILVGDGPMMNGLKYLISEYNLTSFVRLTGGIYEKNPRKKKEKLLQYLALFQIFVSPVWAETFCIANVEALAMGIPVISYGVGGIGEYLRDKENGLLVSSALDSEKFANTIKFLLLNPMAAKQMGRKGQNFVKRKFQLAETLDKYTKLFERLA